jgi:hypothetical protein
MAGVDRVAATSGKDILEHPFGLRVVTVPECGPGDEYLSGAGGNRAGPEITEALHRLRDLQLPRGQVFADSARDSPAGMVLEDLDVLVEVGDQTPGVDQRVEVEGSFSLVLEGLAVAEPFRDQEGIRPTPVADQVPDGPEDGPMLEADEISGLEHPDHVAGGSRVIEGHPEHGLLGLLAPREQRRVGYCGQRSHWCRWPHRLQPGRAP